MAIGIVSIREEDMLRREQQKTLTFSNLVDLIKLDIHGNNRITELASYFPALP